MGRNKAYDRTDITDRAMRLFWQHGYEAASTQQLVEAMGVNRFSLYAEFGSKQGLFEAAMALYDERVVSGHFQRIEADDAGLGDVTALLSFFADEGHARGAGRGCMLCNIAAERASHDAAARLRVQRYVDRIEAGMRNALRREAERGGLAPGVEVDDEARALTVLLLGFFVLIRANVDPALLRGAGRAALRHVAALACPS